MKELYEALKSDVVEIVFTKVNGDKRVMKATLQEEYLPKVDEKSSLKTGTGSANTTAVWSVEDNGWRAFKNDSIISWNIIK